MRSQVRILAVASLALDSLALWTRAGPEGFRRSIQLSNEESLESGPDNRDDDQLQTSSASTTVLARSTRRDCDPHRDAEAILPWISSMQTKPETPTSSTASTLSKTATCPAGFDQCTDPYLLPNSFCCPAGYMCLALATNTTTVCCPPGSQCERIQPITCDLSLQDPDEHPNSVVQTSVLGGVMDFCDSGCCPFGYTCASRSACVKNSDQTQPPKRRGATENPGVTNPPVTAVSHPGDTTIPTGSNTVPSAGSSTPSENATSQAAATTLSTGEPTGKATGVPVDSAAIITGITAAAGILGLLMLVAYAVFLRRSRRKKEKEKQTDVSGSLPAELPLTAIGAAELEGPQLHALASTRGDRR